MKKYKVVQWATGGMGKNCLRAVIDHPAMELVGVYVYGADKEGRDAGTIARREPTGVLATRNVDEILALDADVVIHAARLAPPYGSHDADILRLLAAGKNVISINGYSHPQHWGGERLAALEAACRKGGSSLIGAGLNPGYAGEQLAIVATGVCTEVDHIEVVESVDCRAVRSPDYVFKILGFGAEPGSVDPNDPAWGPSSSLNGMYAEVLATMAARLGMPLERVDTEHRVFPATVDLQIGAGTIPQGRVSHFNWRWHGIVQAVAPSDDVHPLVHGDRASRRPASAVVAHPRAGTAGCAHRARHGEARRGYVTDVGRADCRGRHRHQCDSHRLRRTARHRDAPAGDAIPVWPGTPGHLAGNVRSWRPQSVTQ